MKASMETESHHHQDMTDEEYNRLYPIIRARLSEEENMFWAKTAALNCEVAERNAALWKKRARRWRGDALVLLFLGFALSLIFSWWCSL